MSENKITVERYMDGFNRSDHALILSCLTDDVVWDMPGVYHHVGKDAFDQEIENPGFVGRPAITISRVVEEDDVVVAEGSRRRHHPACRTSGRLRDSPRGPRRRPMAPVPDPRIGRQQRRPPCRGSRGGSCRGLGTLDYHWPSLRRLVSSCASVTR